VRIAEIQTVRSRLRDAMVGIPKTNSQYSVSDASVMFRRLASAVPKRCRDSSIFNEALHRSIENYLIGVDTQGNQLQIKQLPSAIAGNLHSMLLGTPVSPPTSESDPGHYCLALIREVTPVDATCEKLSVELEMLTGSHASDTRMLKYIMHGDLKRVMKTLGVLSTFAPAYERKHPRHLVGCLILVHPSTSDGYSKILAIGSTSSIKSRNKKLSDSRLVSNRYDWCQLEECGLCPNGVSQCRLATRETQCVTTYSQETNIAVTLNPSNTLEPSLEHQLAMW